MDIKSFQEDVKRLSQHLDTKSSEQRILYLISELGELADEVIALNTNKADTSSENIAHIKERIGLEIYDVIWNTVDLANMLDIDLEEPFKKKIAINEKRYWSRSGYLDNEGD